MPADIPDRIHVGIDEKTDKRFSRSIHGWISVGASRRTERNSGELSGGIRERFSDSKPSKTF